MLLRAAARPPPPSEHGVAAIAAGSGSSGGSRSGLREVEAAADVGGVAVALVQVAEPVAVGDQLQDRLVGDRSCG